MTHEIDLMLSIILMVITAAMVVTCAIISIRETIRKRRDDLYYYSLAMRNYIVGDYDLTLKNINKAFKFNKLDAYKRILLELKADILYDLKKYDEAIEICDILIKMNPYNIKYIVRRGWAHTNDGDNASAFKDFICALNGLDGLSLSNSTLAASAYNGLTALTGLSEEERDKIREKIQYR